MSLVELAQIENLLFLNLLRNPNGDPEHARYTIRLQRHLERVRLETMNEERLALQKRVQYCLYFQILFGTYLTFAGSGCMGFGLYSRNLAFFIAGYLVNIMGMIWTVCQILAFVGLRNWRRYYLMGTLITSGLFFLIYLCWSLSFLWPFLQRILAFEWSSITIFSILEHYMIFIFILKCITLPKTLVKQYQDMAMPPPMKPPSLAPVA